MLKKRLIITSLVKKRYNSYLKKTHKFVIEVLTPVAQAYAPDGNNGNSLWAYSIAKKVKDVSSDFKKLGSGEIVTIVYQHVN